MFRFVVLAPALAGLVRAQASTITSTISDVIYDVLPTADALPFDDLLDIEPPTYTSVDGLSSEITSYVTATAIASASADVNASPLSVFPAVTSLAINAAGEDDSSSPTTTAAPEKRGLGNILGARSACDPQATIANYYNVNIQSASGFKADPTIASVASNAPVPTGYFNNFVNAAGANNAYAYLGYAIVNGGKTGYDTQWCAQKCNTINGCLSFNIYFELDPTLEPGANCPNPPAFANIKCSFWGTGLDLSTAKNTGQWRAKFQVAIAGSNAYTSYKLGGAIPNYGVPTVLNDSLINSPARDCAGTFTYMGYKIFQSGPYNPLLCSTACDAQTSYNLAYPPKTGNTPLCAAFGSYILTKTNSTGSYQQGQMCTMYTAKWGSEYALNKVSYDDRIGAKYTYSYSFFYSRADLQPACPSDVNALAADGSDFCTSFLGYSAPTVTSTTTSTPTPTTSTTVATTTTTVGGVVTGTVHWKRQEATWAPFPDVNFTYTPVDNVPDYSAVVLGSWSPSTVAAAATESAAVKRDVAARAAIPTPSQIASWPSARIAQACSSVATGTITVASTVTLAPSVATTTSTMTIPTTLASCVVPSVVLGYDTFVPLGGGWANGQLVNTGDTVGAKYLQLPFAISLFGVSSAGIGMNSRGYFYLLDGTHPTILAMFGSGSNVGDSYTGIYYRIAGAVGSRSVVFAWYTSDPDTPANRNHYTLTFFEDQPNIYIAKYYDVGLSGSWATVSVTDGNTSTDLKSADGTIASGEQHLVVTSPDGSATFTRSYHDRVDCCTINRDADFGGWHSCTEFQPPAES